MGMAKEQPGATNMLFIPTTFPSRATKCEKDICLEELKSVPNFDDGSDDCVVQGAVKDHHKLPSPQRVSSEKRDN